jgi:V8-like Glu-specific endopeptidase
MTPLQETKNIKVSVCGYVKQVIYYHSNEIILTETGGLYDIDTEHGQSGSPVFLENYSKEIVGIHKGVDKNLKLNVCTLITKNMLRELEKWSE